MRARTITLVAALILPATPALAQSGGAYDLRWSSIDLGGGVSAGGAYTLVGTIAQPDAARPTLSAIRTLEPGFWPGVPFLVGCNDADLAEPFGQLDFSDVVAFLVAFGAMAPEADLAPPTGQWDFSDVVTFLTLFGGGCP
ncbi:MAG: GC-type dockerin domain-anchored protein [Phycisphaerales bacterium]